MRPWLTAAAIIALFLVVGLRHLDAVPQVYEDEPWQASTGYKLATQGVFGSDLFQGFYHMDQRYYGFMPLHPLLLAVTFKLTGVGLTQARAETVLLTAVTLALTFALGVRLFDAWVGAVAVAMLVLVRWTGLTYVQLTGIPLIDLARIARYDPLVPVLGLLALHAYVSARRSRSSTLYLLTGILAGLAGLAHVYGLFWVPALLILAAWDRAPKTTMAVLATGAILPWLPYAAYVATDIAGWRGQTAIYASRFELFNPSWYFNNLVNEFHRYGPGLGPLGPSWLLRPGFWCALIALPLAILALARRATGNANTRALLVPTLLFPALFAAFITLKLVNYTLIELPLSALAIAWFARQAWSQRKWTRPLIAAATAAIVIEGGVALGRLDQAVATPYPALIAHIRSYLPAGSRVLGLHTYWLGLQDFDYRSFLVPLNWADEGLPLDEGLSRVAPDIVLLDARMRDYFNAPEVAADGAGVYGWLAQHSAEIVGRIDDPTYGLMEIYRVSR